MLMTYFILGMAFALPELVIVYNWPWLKQLIHRNPIAELVFSLGLSVVLAAVMGVGVGVTLAVANIMSTFITLAVYHLDLVGKYQRAHRAAHSAKGQLAQTWKEFSELIHFVWSLFMVPIRIVAFIARVLNRGAAKVNHISANHKASA
jgi:hypothetical protein